VGVGNKGPGIETIKVLLPRWRTSGIYRHSLYV